MSLLRRGCRRDLTQSAAKYLGGHKTDPEQRGFTKALSDLGKAVARAEPANNSVSPGHLIMSKMPEELGWLVRGHPTLAELGSSCTCLRPALGLWQRFSSGDGHGSRTGFFQFFLWPKGYLEMPWAVLSFLQSQTPHRQHHPLPGCCCLRWQSTGRPAGPCHCQGPTGSSSAVLTYRIPITGGLASSPSTSVSSYSWKHPGVTFHHAVAC